MNNLILFLNAFMSYGLMFVFVIALILIACLIGVNLRKRKNAAEPITDGTENSAS